MPEKNPNRERTFGKKPSFRDMISNSADTQRQKELIQNETDNRYVVKSINIEDISFNNNNNVFNVNDTDEDIRELAESISAYGLITPISVVKQKNGKYLLISGERRTKAHMLMGERKIKAFVYDNLEDYKQQGIFYHANLQSRKLDDTQRFLAYRQLRDYYAQMEQNMKKGDIEAEISKLLGMAVRSVQRMERILKNATDNDLLLLEEGKITFDEFKSRTLKLIEKQTKQQEERKNILAQEAVPTKYIDKNTNTVYYVDKEVGKDVYCTYLTNYSMLKVSFKTPSLPSRTDIKRAQLDLDIVANNNLWDIYTGDMSEYKPKPLVDPNEKKNNTPDISIPEPNKNDNNLSDEDEYKNTTDNNTFANETNNTSDNEVVLNEPVTEEHQIKKSEPEQDYFDTDEPDETEIKDTEKLNPEISSYIGYTVNTNQRVNGPLWISPNGKVYIICNIQITNSLTSDKSEATCIVEEVVPSSVQRIDI